VHGRIRGGFAVDDSEGESRDLKRGGCERVFRKSYKKTGDVNKDRDLPEMERGEEARAVEIGKAFQY
jgi:hypothetical protein